MWMNILNNSRNLLIKGQEEGKKEAMDAVQVRWLVWFKDNICKYSLQFFQAGMADRNTPEVFNSLEKRGGVWSGKASSLTQTGKKIQKEKNHPEGKPVLISHGKGYQSFPQPLWLSGHGFRHCSPTAPGGRAVTSLAGASMKSDPQFDHRHSSVILKWMQTRIHPPKQCLHEPERQAGIQTHNYTQIPLNHI